MTKREAYDRYEDYIKVDRSNRIDLEEGIAKIVSALKSAGVSFHEGNAPMSDVNQIDLHFVADGDFRLDELVVTGENAGSYVLVRVEPFEDEDRVKMTPEKLKKWWDEFSEMPVDNDDRIERAFHIFEKGTDRMEIWKWFDEQCPNGLVKDLLGGKAP
jgi:hypothetical protein